MQTVTSNTLAQNFSPSMTLPWKLVRDGDALSGGRIRPAHIKLYPTNRCNANCAFCMIREWMNPEAEIPTPELLELVRHFHSLGTRAITLAGGGEPTLHPGFDQLLDLCRDLDIQTGIITNGLRWNDKRKDVSANGKLVWARMSVIDSESGTYDVQRLRRFSENLSKVNVGCYATVTKCTDTGIIVALAELAESLPNVTHFKLGEDANGGAPEKMDELAALLTGSFAKIMLHRCTDSPTGTRRCLVSLLRPVVGADGYVYPCCSMGLETGGRIDTDEYRMCHWRDFGPDTPHFDGSVCGRCIWTNYNEALAGLTGPLEHERFV